MKTHLTKNFLLLILLSSLTSCKPIANFFLGVKTKRVVNEGQILEKCIQKGLATDNNFRCPDTSALMTIIGDENISTDGIEIFDGNGYYRGFRDSGYCSAPVDRLTAGLCQATLKDPNTSLHIRQRLQMLKPFSNSAYCNYRPEDYDYTVLVYWYSGYGVFIKKNIIPFETNLLRQTGCRVKVFKVSFDLMDDWH